MTEILQMTSQAQPLQVGVPLYPFSLAGAFPSNQREDGQPSDIDGVAAHVAPLPTPNYEDEDASMNGGGQRVNGMWNSGAISLDTSTSPPYQGY